MPLPRDLSDDALKEEYRTWNRKIREAKSWGAALAAAAEFREDCLKELKRRGLVEN